MQRRLPNKLANHCPRCYKDKRRKYVKIANTGYKGNMVEHEALYRYNTAMKDYFKRYKFEGDRLLEWYLHVTSKALKV